MVSGRSYDEQMEKYPIWISYPRSGSSWARAVTELYFGKSSLRKSPAKINNSNEIMYFHDYDRYGDLITNNKNILYLLRDPTDVIFSIVQAEGGEIGPHLVRLKKHYDKYLNIAKIHVSYEDLKKDIRYFNKIFQWIEPNHILDKEKLHHCLSAVRKDFFVKNNPDKRYFNENMMTKKYEQERLKFKQENKKKIYEKLEEMYNKMFVRAHEL